MVLITLTTIISMLSHPYVKGEKGEGKGVQLLADPFRFLPLGPSLARHDPTFLFSTPGPPTSRVRVLINDSLIALVGFFFALARRTEAWQHFKSLS